MTQVQVDKKLYFSKRYLTMERFISYYHQVNFVLDEKPRDVLEIGVGNKIVSDLLKKSGVNIKNCDIDVELKPDIVSDVRNLSVKDDEFDLVIAYEVLEHLPFDDFKKALEELKRVSKGKVIVSLPFPSIHLEFFLKFKSVIRSRKIVKKIFFALKIPYFLKIIDINKNKQHYWEIGTKGYSKKKVEKILKSVFDEVKSPKIILDSYHKYYILKNDS